MANKNDQNQNEEGQPQVAADNEQKVVANISELKVDRIPPELWVRIFNCLKNPKDLSKCWTLPSASNVTKVLESEDFYYKMTLPFVLPYVYRQDLLACSTVSKSWNAAVDAWMQNAEDFYSDSKLTSNQRVILSLSPRGVFDFMNEIESKDTESSENIEINPVKFRRVEFHIWHDKDINQGEEDNLDLLSSVRRHITKFVHQFGHLIRHLKFKFLNKSEHAISSFDQIKLIQSCLEWTPNVRVLHIATVFPNLYKFKGNLYDLSWPALEHLKVVKYEHFTEEEFAGIANVYAPQLLQVQFGGLLMRHFGPCSERYSALEKIDYLFADSRNAMDFGNFVRSSKCPLKQLTVMFHTNSTALENYAGVTMAANAASVTLETLVFRPFKRTGSLNMSLRTLAQMRLPKLKVFNMTDFEYPKLEFLRNVCPALEQLSVTPRCTDDNGWRMTETGKGSFNLYSQHKFWNQLTHIQKVDVQFAFDPNNDLVNGSQKGCTILVRIGDGQRVKVCFTRREYEAKRKRIMESLQKLSISNDN